MAATRDGGHLLGCAGYEEAAIQGLVTARLPLWLPGAWHGAAQTGSQARQQWVWLAARGVLRSGGIAPRGARQTP
jgi:hypothetical protein